MFTAKPFEDSNYTIILHFVDHIANKLRQRIPISDDMVDNTWFQMKVMNREASFAQARSSHFMDHSGMALMPQAYLAIGAYCHAHNDASSYNSPNFDHEDRPGRQIASVGMNRD